MPNKKKKLVKKKKKQTEAKSLSKKCSGHASRKKIITVPSEASQRSRSRSPTVPKSLVTEFDQQGVKRIFVPYNKFSLRSPNSSTKMNDYQSPNAPTGLSVKERAYIMSCCQARSARYLKLKSLAEDAVKHRKIFSINGVCNPIRTALLERGWVEKIPLKRMTLTRIRNGKFNNNSDVQTELEKLLLSNLVEKSHPNFVWHAKDDIRDLVTIDMNREGNTIFNKLKIDALYTTKEGLSDSMKANYWYYIEDVSDVNGPRTYSCFDNGDIDDFERDYKLTACTSLLKWVLSMSANGRPIFLDTGKVALNVIVFALNRCKEYLFRKQNKDIDKDIGTVNPGQWTAFLKKYYSIISKEEVFQSDTENKLPIYLGFAKFLLQEIHRYRPQLSCEGAHNIWIIKPAHCSRGRGIRLASKLAVITNMINNTNAKYVVQKYIEEPLLIHDTKFDIRQYYLVTSTHPLIIWMYEDCYLKFSSQKYSLKNFHESIHLTNNAVQRNYKNCKGRHPELPQENMWHLDSYKNYLLRIGKEKVWNKIIYPGMKKSIVGIMLSCQDTLSVCKNRFELYGCDFILDKEYKPWLIEINSCPDLNHTTSVTARICPEVLHDLIKVVIDRAACPRAPTGKFHCIYRQPLTVPRYGAASDLFVKGYALSSDYFYKGNINIHELYDNADIDKERDIKTILKKLKQKYDTDIMKEPEYEEFYNNKKKVDDDVLSEGPNTESDELKEAATVITKQLDDLLDRITSENTYYSHSSKSPDYHIPSYVSLINSELLDSLQGAPSTTDILAEKRKPLKRCATTARFHVKNQFTFSKLDDCCSTCKENLCISQDNSSHPKVILKKSVSEANSIAQAAIVEAACKVINFLTRKEIEYKRNSIF